MEDLLKQVNILRGGGGRASVVSMAEGDESAYGSVSGRSSLVSTLDRFEFLVRFEFGFWNATSSRRERDRQLDSLTLPPENGQPDVGLMMKLQSALKEAHREKEVLERRLEDVEGTRNQQESLRLQEVEVENSQLRSDLDRLRQAVAGGGDEENNAVRELTGERMQQLMKWGLDGSRFC